MNCHYQIFCSFLSLTVKIFYFFELLLNHYRLTLMNLILLTHSIQFHFSKQNILETNQIDIEHHLGAISDHILFTAKPSNDLLLKKKMFGNCHFRARTNCLWTTLSNFLGPLDLILRFFDPINSSSQTISPH